MKDIKFYRALTYWLLLFVVLFCLVNGCWMFKLSDCYFLQNGLRVCLEKETK